VEVVDTARIAGNQIFGVSEGSCAASLAKLKEVINSAVVISSSGTEKEGMKFSKSKIFLAILAIKH